MELRIKYGVQFLFIYTCRDTTSSFITSGANICIAVRSYVNYRIRTRRKKFFVNFAQKLAHLARRIVRSDNFNCQSFLNHFARIIRQIVARIILTLDR